MAADDFTWTDFDRWIENEWKPMIAEVRQHFRDDADTFQDVTSAINSVRSSLDTNTAVQTALAKQAQRVVDSWWLRLGVVAAFLAPVAAIVIAVLK